jgi:RND family efflux transporter MFP subunit
MKRTISIVAVVAVLLSLVAFTLVSNKKQIDAANKVVDRSQIAVAVSVAKVAYQEIAGSLQLPAVLNPSRQADISATAAGKINSLNIALGSKVAQGQVIGSVDTRQQQINMKEAQEALTKASADYQLNKELYAGNAGTAQSVQDAQHSLEQARIKAEEISHQIGEGVIKAPISGIVTAKNHEAGEYVNPGVAIATIIDIYNLKAVVFVNEKDVYSLKLAQPATITADVLPGKSFNGKVTFISPVGDENHNYRVELSINNSAAELKAGTYIQVAFDLGKNINLLQIPKLALVDGSKNPYVYVINGEKAVVRKITTGRELSENIEVLSGLQEGDEVVVSGQINLTDGNKIMKLIANK